MFTGVRILMENGICKISLKSVQNFAENHAILDLVTLSLTASIQW